MRGSICGNCKQVRLSRHLTGVALPHSRTARFLFLSTHHRNHSRKRRHDFSQNPKRCVKALLTYRSGRQQVDSIVTPPPATARAPDRPPSRVPLLRIALDRAQACATPMRALQERRCPVHSAARAPLELRRGRGAARVVVAPHAQRVAAPARALAAPHALKRRHGGDLFQALPRPRHFARLEPARRLLQLQRRGAPILHGAPRAQRAEREAGKGAAHHALQRRGARLA